MVQREINPLARFPQKVLESGSVVPVVLEFHQPPVAVYRRLYPQADVEQYRKELAKLHQEFLDKLVSLGINVQLGMSTVVEAAPEGTRQLNVPHDFTYVFNGVGVLMPGRLVAQVAAMADVRAVSLNQERLYLNVDKSVPYLEAPQVWERADSAGRAIRGEDVIVAVIDTGMV